MSKIIKKFTKKLLHGISMRWDEYFIHNLVIGIGVVMVWAGVWGLIEMYLGEYGAWGRILCIVVGIVLLYIVDGDITQLGGKGEDEDE